MAKFKATNLIQKKFDEMGLEYRVDTVDSREVISVGVSIKGGPSIQLRFISRNDNNDVAIRGYELISRVPAEKRAAVLEVCNQMHIKIRHLRFVLNESNDLNVEYDLPLITSDDCVGEAAFEMILRTAKILDENYSAFMKALYA